MKFKLSICILGLPSRLSMMGELVESLMAQPRANEVEILTAIDHGAATMAEKRTRLIAASDGRYICHVDDDDKVSPNYIPAILKAIDDYGEPGPDVVLIRGERTIEKYVGRGRKVLVERLPFDYRIGGVEAELVGGVFYRRPAHLCPVRAEICKAVPFPYSPHVGEDLAWGEVVAPHLKTSARAGTTKTVAGRTVHETLYFYRYEPTKSTPALERRKAELAKP